MMLMRPREHASPGHEHTLVPVRLEFQVKYDDQTCETASIAAQSFALSVVAHAVGPVWRSRLDLQRKNASHAKCALRRLLQAS